MSANMIAGYFDLYWAAAGESPAVVSIGSTGPTGIRCITDLNIDFITGDVLGPDSIVDGIYQGKNVMLQFMLQEVKLTQAKKFLFPYTTSASAEEIELFGTPGTLLSARAGALEAIPRAGTPAAGYHGATLNGRRFIGIIFGQIAEAMDTTKRFIPVTFRAFPFDDAGTLKIFKKITTPTAA